MKTNRLRFEFDDAECAEKVAYAKKKKDDDWILYEYRLSPKYTVSSIRGPETNDKIYFDTKDDAISYLVQDVYEDTEASCSPLIRISEDRDTFEVTDSEGERATFLLLRRLFIRFHECDDPVWDEVGIKDTWSEAQEVASEDCWDNRCTPCDSHFMEL
jgi:hypothetical protein